MTVRKYSNLSKFWTCTFTVVMSNLPMNASISVWLNEMSVPIPVSMMKLVLISAIRTTPNVSILVPVQPNVQLVVISVSHHFANAEARIVVLIILNARKGPFLLEQIFYLLR